VNPPGPQAIIGYGVAVIACISDSLVWAELGAMWPYSGGSYVYLKQLYGEETWGRFMAFMFIWQFFISGPAELASSFIAMSDYLSYITGATTEYWIKTPLAIAFLLFCFFLLYRKINDVGKLALGLWGITIFAVIFTFIAGFSNLNVENLKAPPGAFSDRSMVILGLAAATRFGVYDMTGYYDVCQMGGEVRNPRKTIPYACISTSVCVGTTFILTYLAIGGVMSYYGPDGFGERLENGESVFIMSDFAEKLLGRNFAIFFTLIVVITIFGSAFSMLCGFQYIPQCAAEDGYFFKIFAHRSEKHGGLADVSLITITGTFSFCALEQVFCLSFICSHFVQSCLCVFLYSRRFRHFLLLVI
jgi:amino acid transporter